MPLPPTGTQISLNQIQVYFGYPSQSRISMSQLGALPYQNLGITPGTRYSLSQTFGGWYSPAEGFN